jgi:hypothetical protein
MTTLTPTAPQPTPLNRRRGLRLFDPGGGRSLDQAVRVALDAAADRGSTSCLVCGARAQVRPEGGIVCPSCQSTLD